MDGWHHLLAALGDAVPRLRLRAGADEGKLAAAEAALGMTLPPDYRDWLKIADGQERGGLALFPLLAWLAPIDEVVVLGCNELAGNQEDSGREPCVLQHAPSDPIRCRIRTSGRLVIAMTEEREPLCAIGREHNRPNDVLAAVDGDHFLVLGRSLSTYFERVARLIQRGEVVPGRFDDHGSEVLGTPQGGTAVHLIRDEPEP